MEENQVNIKDSRQINSNLVQTNSNSPEILTNNIYTPAFFRQQIGKLVRVEFLIGTNNLVDRIGILEDVGASYILLRSLESNTTVYADPDLVYQVVYNIVDNALKFTPEGGTIAFGVQRSGNQVKVSIRNSGQGIAQDALPFVFDRFYKADVNLVFDQFFNKG